MVFGLLQGVRYLRRVFAVGVGRLFRLYLYTFHDSGMPEAGTRFFAYCYVPFHAFAPLVEILIGSGTDEWAVGACRFDVTKSMNERSLAAR